MTISPTNHFEAAKKLYNDGLDFAEQTTKSYTGSDRCATAARYIATPLAVLALGVGLTYAVQASTNTSTQTVNDSVGKEILSGIKAQLSSGQASDKTYSLGSSSDKIRVIANKRFAKGATGRIRRDAIAVISQGVSAGNFVKELVSPLLTRKHAYVSHHDTANSLMEMASISADFLKKM